MRRVAEVVRLGAGEGLISTAVAAAASKKKGPHQNICIAIVVGSFESNCLGHFRLLSSGRRREYGSEGGEAYTGTATRVQHRPATLINDDEDPSLQKCKTPVTKIQGEKEF